MRWMGIPTALLACLAAAEEPALAPAARSVAIKRALANSPTWARLEARVAVARWIMDEDSPDHWVIGIGEDHPTHFVRCGTLRIHKRSGAILRQGHDDQLEQEWLADFTPAD